MAQPKPLADLLATCLGPALARQGFSGADILSSWPEIVGERLAAFSQPMRVEWPRRAHPGAPAQPATLVLRAESAFALELQHLAPVILERVNAFYGWRCVGRIVLKQGPVRRPVVTPAPALALDGAGRDRLAGMLEPVGPDDLKAALFRLGTAVLSRPAIGGGDDPPMPQSPAR